MRADTVEAVISSVVNGEVYIHRQMHNPTLLVVATMTNTTIRAFSLDRGALQHQPATKRERRIATTHSKAEEPSDSAPSSSLFT